MRVAVAGLLVVAAWLSPAGVAAAAVISGGSSAALPMAGIPLTVNAAPGELNQIAVVAGSGGIIIRETGAAPLTETAESCAATAMPKEYVCTFVAPGGATATPLIAVNLGDQDDHFLADGQPLPLVAFGEGGNDTLIGGAGSQSLSGGFADAGATGTGDDTISGGPGSDQLSGGDGTDTVSYADHLQPVSVSLDGLNNDGGAEDGGATEAVNGFERVIGGAGDDTLTGGPGPDTLIGGGGNDALDGARGADAYAGGEGDDAIMAFDGLAEDVDCGGGTDTATVDVADRLSTCENVKRVDEVLDADHDGALPPQDCNDANPAIHPGAVDIPGNGVDEDCSGADAQFGRILSGVQSVWRFRGARTWVVRFAVTNVPAGARIELRCRAPRAHPRACPFEVRRRETSKDRRRIDLLGEFGRRRLPPGTVIEVRILHDLSIGKVVRYTTRRNHAPRSRTSCLKPGAKSPRRC